MGLFLYASEHKSSISYPKMKIHSVTSDIQDIVTHCISFIENHIENEAFMGRNKITQKMH